MSAVMLNAPVNPNQALFNWQLLWRIGGLRSAGQGLPGGPFQATPLYVLIDPDEKRVLSYHIGSVLCCLVAEKVSVVVGTPSALMHCSRWPGVLGGNLKPDYISAINNTPQVWEAKCRRNGLQEEVLRKGLGQARSIISVGGVLPTSCIVVQAYGENNNWNVVTADPTGPPKELGAEYKDEVCLNYYAPWVKLIDSLEKIRNADFIAGILIPDDTYVGLDSEIYDTIKTWNPKQEEPGALRQKINGILQKKFEKIKNQGEEATYVNTNGLYCALTARVLKQLGKTAEDI
ncbi:MAG TPA: hypothetical protein VGS07_07865 [Thermoanaerobaculia bacterium]|nr:hypothetical protein [Thermoanaerobaculia bacterium]